MSNKSVLTKNLAIAGTVLEWLPLVALVGLGLYSLFTRGSFMFESLLLLFPVPLPGGFLLLWAALRMRSYRWLIGGALALAVLMLGFPLLLMILMKDSGIPEGWIVAVGASFYIYILALAAIGVGGILLLRELFLRAQPAAQIG